MDGKIRDVEVVTDDGKPLVCQFDPFGQFGGYRSEVAFEAALKPNEEQRVVIRLLDRERGARKQPFKIDQQKGQVVVTTPVYSATVTTTGGLAVRQPRITPPKKTEEDIEDELFGEADEDAPEAETLLPATAGPAVNAPFSGEGLPFAVQGMGELGRPTKVKTWSGPVRAVVALSDPGPWRIARIVAPCKARQSFWFPRKGKRFFFDAAVHLEQEIPRGQHWFAGLRVDSEAQPWQLIMSQWGRPPQVAPVNIVLRNSKYVVLEPYQRATFSYYWAQAVAKDAWVAVVIDRDSSRFGQETQWGLGGRIAPVFMSLDDRGPYTNSVQPKLRFGKLPEGMRGQIRMATYFGGKEDQAVDVYPLSERLNARVPVAYQEVQPSPALDVERLRALVRERSTVVVVPDFDPNNRTEQWNRFADKLGGAWRRSGAFLQFFNVFSGGKPGEGLLVVAVGEPGTNAVLDQINESEKLISVYPLKAERPVVRLIEKEDWPGALLFVAGNNVKATEQAVAQVMGAVGEAPPRPDLSLSPFAWGKKMPVPWDGIRDHEGAFKALAYRNGRAEFLMLLRANRAVSGLKLEAPAGARSRFVPWRFDATGSDAPRVTPVHDAAFPALPDRLNRDQLIAVWISLKIPTEQKPGTRVDTARLIGDGKERSIRLETEVLDLTLTDEPGFGFFPMGEGKAGIKLYYGWQDDADYYEHLPRILRDRGEFGPNAFTMDVAGLKVRADKDGEPWIDSTDFEKELAAVRASGCIDRIFVNSLNYLYRAEFRRIAAARKLGDLDAWELFIPVIRQKLRELGLEDKAICRHGDEIPDYEGWLPQARIYKRCGFKMSVAINGYGVFNKHLAVGTMGLWIPLYNFFVNRWGNPIKDDDPIHFSRKFRDERHADGEEIWPYVCGPGPYAWSTRPRSQARYLILDAYMKGADGLSYYGGTCWSHAVDPKYRETRKADLFGGDCTFVTLFYPDYERKGILPSLRAGSFRNGLEDVTATIVVRKLAAEKGRSEEIEAEIAESYQTIEMNSADDLFDAHRRKLAELYRELAK